MVWVVDCQDIDTDDGSDSGCDTAGAGVTGLVHPTFSALGTVPGTVVCLININCMSEQIIFMRNLVPWKWCSISYRKSYILISKKKMGIKKLLLHVVKTSSMLSFNACAKCWCETSSICEHMNSAEWGQWETNCVAYYAFHLKFERDGDPLKAKEIFFNLPFFWLKLICLLRYFRKYRYIKVNKIEITSKNNKNKLLFILIT